MSNSLQSHGLYNPPAFSILGDSPGKNTAVGCHPLLQGIFPTQACNPGLLHCRQILYHLSHQGSPYMYVSTSPISVHGSVTSDSLWPHGQDHWAPLSMFSKQEYWSGLPVPSPGDLPKPGIKPGSPALQVVSLLTELPGKPYMPMYIYIHIYI